MSTQRRDLEHWLNRRKKLENIYRNFPNMLRKKIDSAVSAKLETTIRMLEPEIRSGNGFEKVINREKERLIVEEVALYINKENSITIESFKENSDGNHPGMIFIPEGEAIIGVNRGFASREEPERIVYLSGFWIDLFPVTNDLYHQLYHSHIPDPHYSDGDIPVVNVTWFDAHKFCSALGKRLPSQLEWEKAARGPNNWIYSFGNEFDNSKVNIWPSRGPTKVSSYEPTPWGLYQMSGNIWEWTADIYSHEVSTNRRVYFNLAKGGSWRHCSWSARTTLSLCLDLGQRSENVGFRCVCSY